MLGRSAAVVGVVAIVALAGLVVPSLPGPVHTHSRRVNVSLVTGGSSESGPIVPAAPTTHPSAGSVVLATIHVGYGPDYLAVGPGGTVYVQNGVLDEPYSQVSWINPQTDAVVGNFSGRNTFGYGYGLAYDPFSSELFVTGWNQTISVLTAFNTTTGANVTLSLGYDSGDLVSTTFDPLNQEVYVVNEAGSNVTVVSALDDKVVGSIAVGSDPIDMAFDPANGDLYVTNEGTSSVSVINGATNTVIASINTPPSVYWPTGIALDTQSGNLYVTGEISENISIINGTTNSLVGSVLRTGSGEGMTFDNATGNLYVTTLESAPPHDVFVTIVNGTTNTVVGSVNLGQQAYLVDVPPVAFDDSNRDVYVAASGGCNCVSVLNGDITYPAISSFYAEPSTIDVGTGTTLNVTTPYNIDSFNYTYTGLPPGCQSANVSHLVCVPSQSGYYTVRVFVNNSLGLGPNATVNLLVNPTPGVVLSATPDPTDANATTTFSATVSGGTGPFSYNWIVGGASQPGGPTFVHRFASRGNYTAEVFANDSYGLSSSDTAKIQVYPELKAALTPSNGTPLLGQTVAFVTNASGGRGPYNYSYSGLPPGCVSENKPAVGCLPTQADYYNVTVSVTDENGVTVNSTVTVHVIFDFNVIVPTNTSAGSPFTISVNTNESFSGGTALVPAAGIGAFSYNYSGLPPGCASEDAPSITCTPTQVGTYHITVSVHDQVGDHQTHTVVVNVVPAKSSAGPGLGSFFSGATGYALIGGIVAAVVIVGVLFVARSRRARPPPKSEEPPSSPKTTEFCPNCGAPTVAGHAFCKKCGKPLN
jgi:YVTN family beta-propeller protein